MDATETTLQGVVSDNDKGEMQWETRAARKIRKRGINRTPKKRNKINKKSLINSQKENLEI